MRIVIPEPSLVVLIGASASGKTTFARRHFKATEVLSSDHARALVSDDENDQSASADAFAMVRFIAARRLRRARLTVIDATNVTPGTRKPLLTLARTHRVHAVAIVFAMPDQVCEERDLEPGGRRVGADVLRRQGTDLRRSLGNLRNEGFQDVYVFDSVQEMDAVSIERRPGMPAPQPEQVDLPL